MDPERDGQYPGVQEAIALHGARNERGDEREDARPALSEVFRDHYKAVARFIRALGIDAPLVDDVAQDVFVLVHRKFDRFVPGASMRQWLLGITRRVVKDHMRSLARTHRRLERRVPRGPTRPVPVDVERHEAAQAVSTILAAMKPQQREVFVLFEIEGLTAPEIARILELKLPTVHSRLRRARGDFESRVRALESEGRDG